MAPTPPDADPSTAVPEPYQLTVRRSFIAQHFLTVPDPGPEGVPHSHEFTAEVTFAAPTLGEYGYVVDIDAVEAALDSIETRYCDTLLNDLPEFDGNPSVERFAERVGDRLVDQLDEPTPTRLVVRLWEDDLAWASHERQL
ncbi:6-pyruvoyl tetrahydropterin synthase family protein [Halosegnis sp.]|uniref:6-pyruvoyl trahydropterin synthase family protein n=1 Tax=Halosegnis sp. TaxID=2864959 RepID=UPI0035D4C1C0